MKGNIKVLDKYLKELEYKGLSPKTITPRKFQLTHFCKTIGKPLSKVSRDDVLEWIAARNVSKMTQRNYRYWIQEFFNFAGNPVEVPKLRVNEKLLTRKELVTPEEVGQMIAALDHPRDRALLHVLYETGSRASEILGLTLKDIDFESTLTKVRLDGKTGPRVVPIYESVPNLVVWLNYCQPLGEDESIWQGLRGPISYSRLLAITQDVSRKVLGRVISPHRLRHSCATEFLKNPHFTDEMVRLRFGCKPGSQVVERYSHLVDQDLEAATLAMHQLEPTKEPEKSPLRPILCPRCGTENPVGSKFCNTCSLVLDKAEALRIMERDARVDEFLEYLVEHPDEVQKLAKKMREEKAKEPQE